MLWTIWILNKLIKRCFDILFNVRQLVFDQNYGHLICSDIFFGFFKKMGKCYVH